MAAAEPAAPAGGDRGEPASSIEVEVVFCPAPGQLERATLRLPPGATLWQAVEASGLAAAAGGASGVAVTHGIWGRVKPPETQLRHRDRVEIYRPLTVDPKEARRLRYRKQKPARSAA